MLVGHRVRQSTQLGALLFPLSAVLDEQRLHGEGHFRGYSRSPQIGMRVALDRMRVGRRCSSAASEILEMEMRPVRYVLVNIQQYQDVLTNLALANC